MPLGRCKLEVATVERPIRGWCVEGRADPGCTSRAVADSESERDRLGGEAPNPQPRVFRAVEGDRGQRRAWAGDARAS